MHWQHVGPSSSSVGMGNASQPDGCVMARMTVEMAPTNFLVPAVSIASLNKKIDLLLLWRRANPTIPSVWWWSHLQFFCVFNFQWPKRVNRQSSAVQTALTNVYRALGAVMEKPTVRMELTKRPVVSRVNYRLHEAHTLVLPLNHSWSISLFSQNRTAFVPSSLLQCFPGLSLLWSPSPLF